MKSSARGEIVLLGVVCVWGTTFVVVKGALDVWQPFSLLAARFSLGVLPFLPLLLRRGTLNAAIVRRGAVIGLLFFLGFSLQTLGLRWTSPARSAFFTAVSVPLVPLLRFAWTRRAPVRGTRLALLLGGAGIFLLLGRGLEAEVRAGDLLTLACALAFALEIIVLADFASRSAVLPLTGVALGTTALLAIVAGAAGGEPLPTSLRPGLGAVLYLGLIATSLNLFGQVFGQGRTSANRAAFLFALEPLFAAFFAWIVRGDGLTAPELAGGALLVGASVLADRPLSRRRLVAT